MTRAMITLFLLAQVATMAASLQGTLTDPQGRAVSQATVTLVRRGDSTRLTVQTNAQGLYRFAAVESGEYKLTAESSGFPIITTNLSVSNDDARADLQFSSVAAQNQSVTVAADVSDLNLFSPDPAQRVMIRDETLDANPGRPGFPLSIPGMPVESPAGGIKPPQYFAPGVAGDHGEPIAMFFQIGGFLYPNNLPANAHGNGYADPNVIIPLAIESAQVDGAAFNVREGNNAVNAGIILGLRDRVEPQVRVTADSRNLNVVGGWSPSNPGNKLWLGGEISIGNGYLKRLEHRKQYKANISKVFSIGKHDLTVYGFGYYGGSFQPGLIPIDTPVANDTIDARQREETSTGALILNDVWHLNAKRQLQLSGFYRYYTLDVRPNFGDGLIRQSEHRNANGEDVLYAERVNKHFSFLAGANFRREQPSALALDRVNGLGLFVPVTSNNLLINFYSPYAAVDGLLTHFLHYNLGYRRDEVSMDNQDLYRPNLSFARRASVNSPKATLMFVPPEDRWRFLPTVALSYGQAFHVNDPRIGTTAQLGGDIVSKARAYQMVVSKTIAAIDFRVTLAHVTTAQQLARISNDSGLQEDQGPGIVKSITITARRNFSHGFVQALYARAEAQDRLTGEPTAEAPRLIWNVLGTYDKLPFHLVARAEYAHVGIKPLGDGFRSVPVREFRGAVLRPFVSKGIDVGVNFLVATGYGGQTVETLALPGEGDPFDRVTGFPIRSYVSASVTYHFRRRSH